MRKKSYIDLVKNPNIFSDKQHIRQEEIQIWSTDTLKDCCQRQASNISGNRLELYTRVYYLYNNNVPEEPSLKKQEMTKQLTTGTKTTDPNNSKKKTVRVMNLQNVCSVAIYVRLHIMFIGLQKP